MARTSLGGRARLTLACAVLLFPACGSGPTRPEPPATPPPAPPPAPRVVAEGAGALPAETLGFIQFTTTTAGRLEVAVDWTFATNDIDIFLVQGFCTDEQLENDTCSFLAFSVSDTAKPERLSVTSAPAGLYTLYAANFGPGDESASYQAVLTPSASGAAAAHRLNGARPVFKRAVRGLRELR